MVLCLLLFTSPVLARSSGTVPGLRLVKTTFKSSLLASSGRMSFIVDVSVPIQMSKCTIQNVDTACGFVHGASADISLEKSEFKSIKAGHVVVLECVTHRWTTDHSIGEGTCDYRAIQGDGTLTITDATFENVQSCAYQSINVNGGAVLAQGDAAGLILLRTKFIRCSTPDTGNGAGIGGAVACWAADFEMNYCTFQDCTSKYSIALFATAASEKVITRCNFIRTTITGDSSVVECGGSGLELKAVTHVKLVDCTFDTTKRSIAGAGGAYGVHTQAAGSLTLTGCTFTNTWAVNGGCIGISRTCSPITVSNCEFTESVTTGNGGVFFFNGVNPGVFAITDSIIRDASASNGVFMYRDGGVEIGTFTMTNTTLDNCQFTGSVAEADRYALLVTVSTTFDFDNNTLSNIKTGCTNPIRFTLPTTITEFRFSDCTFDTIISNRFLFSISGPTTVNSMTLENCIISETKTTNFFSSLANERITPFLDFTLDNCWIEKISMGSSWMLGYSTDKSLKVLNCSFIGGVEPGARTEIISRSAGTIEILDCSFIDIPESVTIISFNSDGDCTFTCRNMTVHGGSGWIQTSVRDSLTVLLDHVNMSDAKCKIHSQNIQSFNVRDSVFTNVQQIGNAALITLMVESCKVTNCEFRDIHAQLFAISEPTVWSTTSDFTFSNCCFQGAAQDVLYIKVGVPGMSDNIDTITFERPICFDLARDSAVDLENAKAVVGLEESMFGCTDCEQIPETDPTSESLEPTEDFDTSEPTEDVDTSEPTEDFDTSEPTEDVDTPGPTEDFDTSEPTEDVDTPGPTEDVDTSEPTETTEDTGHDGGSDGNPLSPGAAAGIAIAVIAVVAAVVAVIVVLFLRKKKSRDSDDDDEEMFDEDSAVTEAETVTSLNESFQESPNMSNPLFTGHGDQDDFSSAFEEGAK